MAKSLQKDPEVETSLLATFINKFKKTLGLQRDDFLDKQKKEMGKWENILPINKKIQKIPQKTVQKELWQSET